MDPRPYAGIVVVLMMSLSGVRAGEYIAPPDAKIVRFMRTADEMFIFPDHTPNKPRRDNKRVRPLASDARRALLRIIGNSRAWYNGWDNRVGIGPPPKDIGLLFRADIDELALFFSAGEIVRATFNGRMLEPRWSFEAPFEGAVGKWKTRYAQPELKEKQ